MNKYTMEEAKKDLKDGEGKEPTEKEIDAYYAFMNSD